METTYLKKFIDYSKKKVAFIPLGTIEWHGNHLPVETDFLVAQKICEVLSKKVKGYLLPPIYLGTDKEQKVGNRKLIGMNSELGKELQGSLYYIKPNLLLLMIESLVDNLIKQGFTRVYIVTGHAASPQIEALEKIAGKYKNVVVFLNPFKNLSFDAHHADEYETSLFWACCPGEEEKSRKIKISATDDYLKYKGYDPRDKASLKIGKKMLDEIIKNLTKKIS
jgi:creatinine amidohydrolase